LSNSQLQVNPGRDPFEGVSTDGIITTGARRSRISVEFRPVLERAVEHLNSIEGTHSLYVYGSVATGSARVGSSDVDLVTIGLDGATSRRLGETLTADFAGLCRGVEIGPAQLSGYEGSGDEAYGNRVFLRHYCVHLAGPDVAHGLPEFPADRAAARGFNGDIGLCADRWRAEVLRAADPAVLGRRIARKTLLAVAGLVSVHDRTWTTDRFAAARRWAMTRPRLASPLDTLVAWGSGGEVRPSPSEVQRALDGVVAEVVDEFRSRIGLWNSADG
jgi:hypothetical protein